MANSETNITKLYRVENPNIPSKPNGITSHEDLVGQWFSPDLDDVVTYLSKSTQTYGREAKVVDGARLVIAEVPSNELQNLEAQTHTIAARMDIEPGNYIVPRDGTIPIETIPLDEIVGELRGGLNKFDKFTEAKRRIVTHLGHVARK